MIDNTPQGFILSDAALYAFKDQDVYPDILSFCVAIPDHLKPLFLIPIQIETSPLMGLATKVASLRYADGAIPTGDTEEGDLFAVKTFVYDDNEPLIPEDDPGSIFDMDSGYEKTHHQEYHFDENIQSPTDTSYMSDVDITQYQEYPYRTKEKPVRHSSDLNVVIIRLALTPEELDDRTPEKIRDNAESCVVQFISFDKRNRVYTFTVTCGSSPKTVKASLSDIRHAAINCNCPFWQWNGPEYNAKANQYLLGDPYGTATPPDIRDPDRKYGLCKHAYAVIKRLDHFVQEIMEENQHLASDEEAMLDEVDNDWDRLEGVVQIPLEEVEAADDIDVEWEPIEEEPEEALEEEFEEALAPEEPEEEEEEVPPEEEEEEEEEAPPEEEEAPPEEEEAPPEEEAPSEEEEEAPPEEEEEVPPEPEEEPPPEPEEEEAR